MNIIGFKENLLKIESLFQKAKLLYSEIEPIQKRITGCNQYVPYYDSKEYSQSFIYDQDNLDNLQDNFTLDLLELHIELSVLILRLQYFNIYDHYEKMVYSFGQNISKIDCARKNLSDLSYSCKKSYLVKSRIFIKKIQSLYIEESLKTMYYLFEREDYSEVVDLYEEIFSIRDVQAYYRDRLEINNWTPSWDSMTDKHPTDYYLKAKIKIINPTYKFERENDYYNYVNQTIDNRHKKFLKKEELLIDEENVYNLFVYNLHSELNFGIHQGKKIGEVLETYPEYVLWCIINLIHFSLHRYYLLHKNLVGKRNYHQALEIALVKNFINNEWKIEEKIEAMKEVGK